MLSAKINLFLIKLIFKWRTMMLLDLSTLCCWVSRKILSKLFRKTLKLLTKRDTPARFKCNLLLLRCLLGMMLLCDTMPTLFALHNSSKTILTSSTFLKFSSSRGTLLETITVLLSNFRELTRFKVCRDIYSGVLLEDRSFVPTFSLNTSWLKSLKVVII